MRTLLLAALVVATAVLAGCSGQSAFEPTPPDPPGPGPASLEMTVNPTVIHSSSDPVTVAWKSSEELELFKLLFDGQTYTSPEDTASVNISLSQSSWVTGEAWVEGRTVPTTKSVFVALIPPGATQSLTAASYPDADLLVERLTEAGWTQHYQGSTPWLNQSVPSQFYRLTLSKSGYHTVQRVVFVAPGEVEVVSEVLVKLDDPPPPIPPDPVVHLQVNPVSVGAGQPVSINVSGEHLLGWRVYGVVDPFGGLEPEFQTNAVPHHSGWITLEGVGLCGKLAFARVFVEVIPPGVNQSLTVASWPEGATAHIYTLSPTGPWEEISGSPWTTTATGEVPSGLYRVEFSLSGYRPAVRFVLVPPGEHALVQVQLCKVEEPPPPCDDPHVSVSLNTEIAEYGEEVTASVHTEDAILSWAVAEGDPPTPPTTAADWQFTFTADRNPMRVDVFAVNACGELASATVSLQVINCPPPPPECFDVFLPVEARLWWPQNPEIVAPGMVNVPDGSTVTAELHNFEFMPIQIANRYRLVAFGLRPAGGGEILWFRIGGGCALVEATVHQPIQPGMVQNVPAGLYEAVAVLDPGLCGGNPEWPSGAEPDMGGTFTWKLTICCCGPTQ